VVAAHYKKDNLLNCWTSCSDISGYHAVCPALSEQGRADSMAWQGKGMGATWALHAMCESALTVKSWSFVLQPAPRHCHLNGPLTVILAIICVSSNSEVQHEALSLPANSRRTFEHLVSHSLESDDTSLLIFRGITYYFSANFGTVHRVVFEVKW